MHGRVCEERKREQHMWTGLSRANSGVAGDVSPSSSTSASPANSFCKDGWKICVGDCALFKPPQDSPPFIGIIRVVTPDKENKLKLGVSWLYRPADVQLGKGILLESAPNEIFYSFHKDEIPAASLLHPCKVAFLPKDVELPSGISSFVCRRVYDIKNKCLWWLTDQNYINELQEEINQLLYKTSLEMHEGRSPPKPMSSPTSTSQLKANSHCVQNSASSVPSQVKGKKRERGDQGSEPLKRERLLKADDGDSRSFKIETWKSEIAKFAEKGGLVDNDGVEKLLQLMIPEKNGRKIDLVGQTVVAGVVAATEKPDCLNQFVQRGGLSIFDDWLQDIHKGKMGDVNSTKDGDKSVEEFLLVLLRALDRLPVYLQALQMCNIGKSVNHLRSHKNYDIQRKARSLVDIWKKRVAAEMNARSGSNQTVPWPVRHHVTEVSQAGNRQSDVSSDVAIKSTVAHLALKAGPIKLVQGEAMSKSSPSASTKLLVSPASVTQPHSTDAIGTSELPSAVAREEKSTSSSQSHNNTQSCSSDHAKTGGFSGKEDARSSTTASMALNKGTSTRHRKFITGLTGSSHSPAPVDCGAGRSSPVNRNPVYEKLLQSTLPIDKAGNIIIDEVSNNKLVEGSNNKLIVKIPNRGRSPAQNGSGGSLEDPSVMNSRASSPMHPEKLDQSEHNLKEKTDICRSNFISAVNAESWQSNDFKEALTGSEEDGSPGTKPSEKQCRTGDDSRKLMESLKAATSSPGNEIKHVKEHDATFNSINALVESCVKYSQAEMYMSMGDDVGINLLASVAAGEMSKSDPSLPNDCPLRNSPVEDSCTSSDLKVKSCLDDSAQENNQSVGADDEHGMQTLISDGSLATTTRGGNAAASQLQPKGELNERSTFFMAIERNAEPGPENNSKLENLETGSAVSFCPAVENTDGGGEELMEKKASGNSNADRSSDCKEKISVSVPAEDKSNDTVVKFETEATKGAFQNPSTDADMNEVKNGMQGEEKVDVMHSELDNGIHEETLHHGAFSEDIDKLKSETASDKNVANDVTGLVVGDLKDECMGESLCNHGKDKNDDGPDAVKSPVAEQQVRSRGSSFTGIEAEECTSDVSPSTRVVDREAKLEFDLNEGINTDDGKYGDLNFTKEPACSAAMQLIRPILFPVSSVASSSHTEVTVAAAERRPFVPPEDLLKNRGELGWKGSAATSAFRPAEPRRVMESTVGVANTSFPNLTTIKSKRPPLDFDLNIPGEAIFEVTASDSDLTNSHGAKCNQLMGTVPVRNSTGLSLDLNRVEEPMDIGNRLACSSGVHDLRPQPVRFSSDGLVNGVSSSHRDFDLNDGPIVDEISTDPLPFVHPLRSSAPLQLPSSSVGMTSKDVGKFSSWLPQGNAYPNVSIQSMLPDRGDPSFQFVGPGGPQRFLAPPTGNTLYSSDAYRGPILSSSPAVPFPSTAFQYPVFPFGSNIPLPSASFSGGSATYVDSSPGGRLCFPAMPAQVLAPAGAVPHYSRPFIVSLPDSNVSVAADSGKKWTRQGLDLNTGPLGLDVGGSVEISSLASRQLPVGNSQALPGDQTRLYQLAGGNILKRPEPDGGWEGYKQTSWQ